MMGKCTFYQRVIIKLLGPTYVGTYKLSIFVVPLLKILCLHPIYLIHALI